MKKILLILKIIFSIPKTIYLNFKVFEFKTAIKFPVFISNNVKIKKIYKNCIIIENEKIKPFMVIIGLAGTDAINSSKGLIFLNKKEHGKIIFKGNARFGEGIKIYNNSGKITFGNNFIANKNCSISSDDEIVFGDDNLIGWNTNIRDSDGHKIFQNGTEKEERKKVVFGNHVWICSYVDILKGNNIGNDCVVAYRSCLTGGKFESNSLIGGYPAKILKNNIDWKK